MHYYPGTHASTLSWQRTFQNGARHALQVTKRGVHSPLLGRHQCAWILHHAFQIPTCTNKTSEIASSVILNTASRSRRSNLRDLHACKRRATHLTFCLYIANSLNVHDCKIQPSPEEAADAARQEVGGREQGWAGDHAAWHIALHLALRTLLLDGDIAAALLLLLSRPDTRDATLLLGDDLGSSAACSGQLAQGAEHVRLCRCRQRHALHQCLFAGSFCCENFCGGPFYSFR